eukprot:TRINITY_DN35481_c0_g1_i1.p1 TRINITY_DN35481_c0_g1~~TRINITY_DN35481_c0_g1_i1.p1  ORF type:complete len:312 (-),score=54.09 TRINITY_DN35481_c0_g1_i1:148-1005(-)
MAAVPLLRSESLPAHLRMASPSSSSGRAKQQHTRPRSRCGTALQAQVDFIPPAFFQGKGTSALGRAFAVAAAAERPAGAGAIGRPGSAPNRKGGAKMAAGRLRRGNSSAGLGSSPNDPVKEQFFEKPFSIAYKEVDMARNLRKLEILFRESDHDHSGEISLDEFRKALRMPGLHHAFANLGIQPHQCEKIFVYLDDDKSGSLTIDEFITGLTDLVGMDIDGTGMELDIGMLCSAYQSKQKQLKLQQKQPTRSASTGQLGQKPLSLSLEPAGDANKRAWAAADFFS